MADTTITIGSTGIVNKLRDLGDGTYADVVSPQGGESVQPTGLATVATGERAGSVAAVQLATVTAKYVRFKARMGNPGVIWIGNSNAVTVGAGTTTTTCGFPLWAGEDTGWLPASNLNKFWIICANATDHLTYMVMV